MLVRTLVYRIFKINNTWAGFHLDINNLTKMFRRNSFPSSVIENVVRKFLNNYFTPDSSQSVARKGNCLYFKLPYIGPFSIITQRRIKKLVNALCSDLEIKLVFTPFKIKSWFGDKDPFTAGLRSRVIFKFSCAGCSACYIGENSRHFATRIASDKHYHIFKHLRGSENCRSLCSEDCFKILDSASTSFQLKIKEAMRILWEQPSLNSQVKHLILSLSYLLVSFLSLNSLSVCFYSVLGFTLIIYINVSLCDTTYRTTSFYFVQLTMDNGSSETCLD